MWLFPSLKKQLIKEQVLEARERRPHRISFAYTHPNQPKRSTDHRYVGFLSLPFLETVNTLLRAETSFSLEQSQYGYWCRLKDELDFSRVYNWARRQGTRIFLRDCLELSVALDQNFKDNTSGQHTELGALEARAKHGQDEEAINGLVDGLAAAIQDMAGYCDARHIAGVPGNVDKPFNLPSVLAQRLADRMSLEDLTPRFTFRQPKQSIKNLPLAKKWDAWEQTGLTMAPELSGQPAIILIDDKYQSGLTLQYVASRLYAAGAGKVYGLCAVKTLRDTDNQ